MGKHHYVPEFYQKGFADGEGLVWVYDRMQKWRKPLPPRVVCSTEHFYSVRHEGKPPDEGIESSILQDIDAKAAPTIRKIESGTLITPEEKSFMALFIGFQYARVPVFERAARTYHEAMVNERTRIEFQNIARAAATLERDRETLGDLANMDPAAVVESVRSPGFKISATERVFLETMFQEATTLAEFLARSSWTILKSSGGSGFITSDNPFVPLPPRHIDLRATGSGYGIPGTINYFPLTRKTCLEMRYGGAAYGYQVADWHCVRAINRNTTATSDRFVIATSERQLVNLVHDCGLDTIPFSQPAAAEVVVSNDSESLIRLQRPHPPRYFYCER